MTLPRNRDSLSETGTASSRNIRFYPHNRRFGLPARTRNPQPYSSLFPAGRPQTGP